MGYEINQLFVAETFQQLYADGRGQPRLSREEMHARQELCEDEHLSATSKLGRQLLTAAQGVEHGLRIGYSVIPSLRGLRCVAEGAGPAAYREAGRQQLAGARPPYRPQRPNRQRASRTFR